MQDEHSLAQALHYFREAGLDLEHIHPDWSCRYDNGPRKGHIETWLAAHPEVMHYVVIDDKPVDVKNLVLVDPFDGLRTKDFIKLARILDIDLQALYNVIKNEADFPGESRNRVNRLKIPTPTQP